MNSMSMKEKLAKIQSLPQGVTSPSGHYWCATCKKLFRMDTPTCPYMTGMCVNQAIPIEHMPVPGTVAYERFGLFYPKFPQRALARLVEGVSSDDRQELGKRLADVYLDELREWNVKTDSSILEAMKSFLVFASGCEVAQRLLGDKVLFVILDPQNVWPDEQVLKEILLFSLGVLAEQLGMDMELDLDFIQIVPGRLGRYHCAKCAMYFEFGKARDNVICPLMPQKCMFNPNALSGTYPLEDLLKLYRITPGLYAGLMHATRAVSHTDVGTVREALFDELKEWGFVGTNEQQQMLAKLLGLEDSSL